jgi:hypothetical protein
MDASLVKILRHNTEDIRAGDVSKALRQAKSYLSYIHKHNYKDLYKEFKEYKKAIKLLIDT